MRTRYAVALLAGACLAGATSGAVAAETAPPAATNQEYVQVTSTRIPESPDGVPAAVTVMTGEELRIRGAKNLRDALFLVAGVDIAPLGDAGPASSVPEILGLREFDAYLLVVDGVPWGGAFNPDTLTLSLADVARIELLRGPAPVLFGATSFSGVIQVVHSNPGATRRTATLSAGSYSGGAASYATALPTWAGIDGSLVLEAETQGFRDDRTQYDRGLVSWRNSRAIGKGNLRFGLAGAWLQQDPGSPHPRTGPELDPTVPLDANHTPSGSEINTRRITGDVEYSHPFRTVTWTTLLALSESATGTQRGFLTAVDDTVNPNANGFRQSVDTSDIFFDSHLAFPLGTKWSFVTGLDWLYGRAEANGADFDYYVPVDGTPPADVDGLGDDVSIRIADNRNFAGVYAQAEWHPLEWLRFDFGGRYNDTSESRSRHEQEAGVKDHGSDDLGESRGTGQIGASARLWHDDKDSIHVYADYRRAFKPAAFDAGLDSDEEILDPETAHDWEGGAKGVFADGNVRVGLQLFQMTFENLVVSQISSGGLPVLENAGNERFRGGEIEGSARIHHDWWARANYARHDSRFLDYVTEFGGVPTQLAGKRLEMSAKDLASGGVIWRPDHGLFALAEMQFVGARYLNKRNTALAEQYETWSAGIGWRNEHWEIRLDGENLNDARDPVAESELGDAQYYRLPARSFTLSGHFVF